MKRYHTQRHIIGWLALLLVVVWLPTGCTDKNTREQTRGTNKAGGCGVTDGAFRQRWWNFFERGMSFAGCKMWPQAEADLREAITQMRDDQRQARTYGMHFIDYFPHRELGIVLYGQGRLQEAIQELEKSLATAKSAKAELYLDQVRKDWIERNGLDRLPPSITVDSPNRGTMVQGFKIQVQGRVQDDTFVKAIEVNGIAVRIDLAAVNIPFSVEVPLKRGQNRLTITAVDIVGKRQIQEVLVEADREGPMIGIQTAQPGERLQAAVEDPAGLAAVRINGQPQTIAADGTIDQALPIGTTELLVEAIDQVGNMTVAQLDFTERLNKRMLPPILLAANNQILWTTKGAMSEGLWLNYRQESGIIYRDHVYLEGHVTQTAGVKSIRINTVELLRRPGRTVFFSQRLALLPGVNTLRIEVQDQTGRTLTQSLTLTRQLTYLERREARYRLALVGEQAAYQTAMMPLWEALQATSRFQPSGDGPLEAATTVSSAKAAALARAQQAHGVLLTRITHNGTALEYSGQVVDALTEETLFLVDVYADQVTSPPTLAAMLLRKVSDALPVVDGQISELRGQEVAITLLGAYNLTAGLPLIIYRNPTALTDPSTGAELGAEQVIVGEAHLGVVATGVPLLATLVGSPDVKPGDLMQTR